MMEHMKKFQWNGLVKMLQNNQLLQYLELARHAFIPLMEGALYYTIPLSVFSFTIGLILATFIAIARIIQVRILNYLAASYVSIIRGTPLLVQLFIIFYGLPSIGIVIDPFPAAIIGFSLNVGAYASEVIRGGILSVPKGQWEAAFSMGMNFWQALSRVVLPQAFRMSIPPLSNTYISLVKDTSLAAMILVTEIFRKSQELAATHYEFLLIYCEAALMYWVICFILSLIQSRIEVRIR